MVAKVLREEVAAAHVRPHAPDGVAAVVVAVVEKRHAQRRPKKGVLGIEPFLDLNGAARGYPLGGASQAASRSRARRSGMPASQCACRVEREAA